MGKRGAIFGLLVPLAGSAGGCTSISSNYGDQLTAVSSERIFVCSGFDCTHQTRLSVTASDAARFAAILSSGAGSPEAERAAIAEAVAYFETRATQAIGVRDAAKSTLGQSGRKGQMDCIDESTNTRSLLRYLEERGLLRHHGIGSNVRRGFLLDGRYFHATAVIRDPDGVRWAVDSWYEPGGGLPDIMALDEWMRRGVMGER